MFKFSLSHRINLFCFKYLAQNTALLIILWYIQYALLNLYSHIMVNYRSVPILRIFYLLFCPLRLQNSPTHTHTPPPFLLYPEPPPHIHDIYQDDDYRRMEFQRYLEKSNVVETITKVLAALYELPEKPLDSNEFIRDFLSVSAPDDVEKLRKTLTANQTRLNQLDIDLEMTRNENAALRRELDRLDGKKVPKRRKKQSTDGTLDGGDGGDGGDDNGKEGGESEVHFQVTQ